MHSLLRPSTRIAARAARRFGASYWRLFRANFLRAWRLQLRSKLFM